MNIYTIKIMEEIGLELRKKGINRCLYYNDIPLPGTLNKSDEYLEGYVNGFARHNAMQKPRKIIGSFKFKNNMEDI